jgi:phage terminase large subunit-like protein
MFSRKTAERHLRFISNLKLTEGRWAGRPFELMPWQRKAISTIFGTLDEDGYRQYRQAYFEIPKKNGKTPLAAAIALDLLFNDGEEGAQIYSAATERDQAAIAFRIAARMVRQSSALEKRCKIVDSRYTIYVPKTGSFYRAISADAKSKHGFNIHGLVFDELHALEDRKFWEVLTEGSGDARTQPLFVAITTAGFDRKTVCWELHEHAEKIAKGLIDDPRFFAMVFSLPDDADWESSKNWRKVNPALGHILDMKRIREHHKAAIETPTRINAFRRYRLCQWTQAESRFLNLADWDASAGQVLEQELLGRFCYGGLDLSSNIDVSAFELVFPMEDGQRKVISRFWIPEDNMQKRVEKDRVPYDHWVRAGFIKATPGNVIDYEFIKAEIRELAKRYRVMEISFDRWGATEISTALEGEGFQMAQMGQGFASMNAPMKELEKLVLSRQLEHGGNPVLRWMADNLVARMDAAGNIKPDKEKSTEKIDGMVALVMALDGAMAMRKKPSVYEKRGVIAVGGSPDGEEGPEGAA